jgi:hypothetical protein
MKPKIAQVLPPDNSARAMLRRMLAERRAFPPATADWEWRTNAARKYVNLIRRVPVNQWRDA